MMSFSKFFKYCLALVVSLVLIFSISLTQRKIDTMIRQHDLFFTGQINNAPPMVAFTTMALGSFRGLIADLLWLRAASLQEDKNYYEMVQLASWITKLQPRFASATAYLAWNMAYNISVTCSLWEDRWYWVWEGIKLIRDEALLYNPDDQKLYWELAVIFQQKMGNVLDNASYYYKTRLAEEMQDILDADPDPRVYREPEWDKWAVQPKTKAEFMKAYPEDSPLWSKLHKLGFKDFEAFNNDFRAHKALRAEVRSALGKDAEAVDLALRNIWLNDKYRLESNIINDLNKKYGNMDWRLPEAQALYWASEGIRRTGRHNMQCSRIIATCLQEMMRAGRVLWTERDGYKMLIMNPNLDLIKSACETYDWARTEADNLDSFRTGKINFMKNGILFLYFFGRYSEAKEVFEILKKDDYTVKHGSLEALVDKELKETLETATFKQITDIINAFIRNSLDYLAADDVETSMHYANRAYQVYVDYQSGISSDKEKERRGLAPYNQIRNQVVRDYLKTADPTKAAIIRAKMAAQQAAKEAEAAEKDK